MRPEELRESLKQQPFEPFRLVLTDGVGYEVRLPDLLWVGRHTPMVGLVGERGQTFYERAVKLDLLHVVRLEPLEPDSPGSNGNGRSTDSPR